MKKLFLILILLVASLAHAQGVGGSAGVGGKGGFGGGAVAAALNTTQLLFGSSTVPTSGLQASPYWWPMSSGENDFAGGSATSSFVFRAWQETGTFKSFTVSLTGTTLSSSNYITYCINYNGTCLSDSNLVFNNVTCSTNPCTQTATLSDATASIVADNTQLYNIKQVYTGTPTGTGISYIVGWQPSTEGDTVLLSTGTATTATFIQPNCGSCVTATESQAQMVVPVSGTLKNLTILAGDPGAGATLVFTVRKNLSSQTQTCTITHSTGSPWICQDTGHAITVTAGDTYDIDETTTGSPSGSEVVYAGMIFAPTVAGEFLFGSCRSTATLAGGTLYLAPTGRTATATSTEYNWGAYTGTAFTLHAMGAYVGTAPSPGNYTFNLRSCTSTCTTSATGYASVSTVTVQITASNQTANVGSLTASIGASAYLDTQSVPAASPAAQGSLSVGYVGYIAPH